MRFEVPQYIDVEDKIFGPFTWKQFVYLGGGVGFAVVLFFTAHFFVFVLLGVPIGALGILFAFYKVNSRSFSGYLEAMMKYFSSSRLYLWKRGGTGIYHGQNDTETQNDAAATYIAKSGQGNINSLARKLELKAIQKQS